MEMCHKCKIMAPSGDFLICGVCRKRQHVVLSGTFEKVEEKSEEFKNSFICEICKSAEPSTSSDALSEKKFSPKKTLKEYGDFLQKGLKEVQDGLKVFDPKLENENKIFKKETAPECMSDVWKKLEEYKNSQLQLIGDIKNDLALFGRNMEMMLELLMNTQNAISFLRIDVDSVNDGIEYIQQNLRRDNVMIRGVPEIVGEDLFNVILLLCKIIEYPRAAIDISNVHRIPTWRQEGWRPIIVQFVRRIVRNDFYDAFKRKTDEDENHTLDSRLLYPTLPKSRIYVAHHLTHGTVRLLDTAREAARKAGYQHVWATAEGTVFIKDAEDGRVIKITSVNDLIDAGFVV